MAPMEWMDLLVSPSVTHDMQIVEVDRVWTEPANASVIYISSAQRYCVPVTMKNENDCGWDWYRNCSAVYH